MVDIKKGQFMEIRGANPYLLPRNARQCPNHFFHHVNQERIYNEVYGAKEFKCCPQYSISMDKLNSNLEYFREALEICEEQGLTPLMTFSHNYSKEVICQFYATAIFLEDEGGFRSLKWMTREHVMEATWEEFARGIGYELHDYDTDIFKIHLQPKPMAKEKMADLYIPGRMLCGSAYHLLPVYDIMNRIYRSTINPKHTNHDEVHGFLVNLLARTHEMRGRGKQLDVMDYIWHEMRPGSIALFGSSLGLILFAANSPSWVNLAILRSPYYHPLKGTTLSTSAALDAPSVIDKLVSPPHASHAGTSAESENSYDIDNVSAVLDDSGSLGSFLDATIARSRQIENTETPDATTPVNSPELDYSSDDPDEDYVELNDDLINRCNATADANMREAKKSLKEKGIKSEDVKNLPPIEDICEIIPPSSMIEKRKMDNYNFGEVFQGETTSTGRPSRSSTRFRQSYNEDLIAPSFAPEEDNGVPNASSFPCYDFLRNAGLLEDFLTLVGKAGLTTYVGDESEQYYTLTKIFVESFKFNNKHFHPTVSFKIYGKPITMKLEIFCAALGIVPVGTARKIEDNPRELLELYRGITNDDCRTIQRGKIRNIQLPAIKYFAYYIGTSILGRENTSNISSYHLGFLIAALTGDTPYHLGALVARRLSNKGPIFGGVIASRVLAYLELPLDPNDVKIAPMRLDIAAMKSHQFVTTDSSLDKIVYRILFADGEEREILLPQPDLFSIDRKPWSRSKEEVDEQLKIQGFHQQHDSEDAEPSYDYTVTYPGASSSTYPEYDPSSYYEGASSWAPWD
ncbi:hypothetical protein QYE76_005191 [Lolium multiflorum]|uniref:Arabidopsis retrotransposon Orf1 C-terminal domain-containing protein n=1 Tax=Lolium multiflorum TaxID=4521 RepID=A0AAD8RS54_LOLMU|nr:hypothetical protein QYE76_005191 [Lolium multiflorum]